MEPIHDHEQPGAREIRIWAESHDAIFHFDGDRTLDYFKQAWTLDSEVPAGAIIRVDASNRSPDIQLHLSGRHIPAIELSDNCLTVVGPGSVSSITCVATTDRALELRLSNGARAGRVDASEVTHAWTITLQDHASRADELDLGTGPISGQRNAIHSIGKLVVGSYAGLPNEGVHAESLAQRSDQVGRLLAVDGQLNVTQEVSPTRYEIRAGAVVKFSHAACPTEIRVEALHGELSINEPRNPLTAIRVDSGNGLLKMSTTSVAEVEFDPEARIRWWLTGCTIDSVRGADLVQLYPANTSLSGGENGLLFDSLEMIQDSWADLEGANFYGMETHKVQQLEAARHVTPWWPPDKTRPQAVAEARDLPSTISDEARERHWSRVERLLSDKGASGRDLTRSHEIAQELRRHTSTGTERFLLTLSWILGHSCRFGRPLVVWLLSSLAVTLGILWIDESALTRLDQLRLWFEVVVSPVTFIRPTNDGSLLAGLAAGNGWIEFLAFCGRAVGTAAIAAMLLTLRRYLKSTS